jgi:hypothetical protein
MMYDELSTDTFEPNQEKSLLIPVDDIVLGTVQHLSDGVRWRAIEHWPAFTPTIRRKMFGPAAIGVQVGAKHTAPVLNGVNPIKVEGVYSVPQMASVEAEFPDLRKGHKFDAIARPKPDEVLLVLTHHGRARRYPMTPTACSASALVCASGCEQPQLLSDRTVDGARPTSSCRSPTTFFSSTPRQTWIRRDVSREERGSAQRRCEAGRRDRDGTFVEVKRLARVDLSGKTLDPNYTASDKITVMRKEEGARKANARAARTDGRRAGSAHSRKGKKPRATPKPVAPARAGSAGVGGLCEGFRRRSR